MGCPETSVTITLRCVTFQKSEGLIYTAAEAWNHKRWLLYITPGLTYKNSTFCPHSVFMCFVWIWEQTAIISLYSINWLVFVTEMVCIYCAVRSAHIVYRPGTDFSTSVFPCQYHSTNVPYSAFPSVSFHQCSILSFPLSLSFHHLSTLCACGSRQGEVSSCTQGDVPVPPSKDITHSWVTSRFLKWS
jgi:hypothetical protein